jgi:hypothetical protein
MQYSVGLTRNRHTYEVSVLIARCVNDSFTDEELLQKAIQALSRKMIHANRNNSTLYWRIEDTGS